MYLRQPETTVTGETNIMRIYYVPIVLEHSVGSRVMDVHGEIKYGIFYEKITKRIGHLYTSVLSHILDPYTQREREHNTFSY